MVLKRESELGDCADPSDPRQREIVSEIAAPLESRQTPSCTRRNGVDQSANGSKVELADMPPRYQPTIEDAAATAAAPLTRGGLLMEGTWAVGWRENAISPRRPADQFPRAGAPRCGC